MSVRDTLSGNKSKERISEEIYVRETLKKYLWSMMSVLGRRAVLQHHPQPPAGLRDHLAVPRQAVPVDFRCERGMHRHAAG